MKKKPYTYTLAKYESMKKWRRKNREKYLRYQRDFQRDYNKAWKKQYFETHPDKKEEYHQRSKIWHHKYWFKNKKALTRKHKVYYWANRERILESKRQWRIRKNAENAEKV